MVGSFGVVILVASMYNHDNKSEIMVETKHARNA